MNAVLPSVIQAFEQKYRNDHGREHGLLMDVQGHVLARHTGTHDQVEFDDQDLQRAVGGYITHTHPHALAPSGADLAIAAQYGLTLRAVGITPEGKAVDYTVRFPEPIPSVAKLLPAAFDSAVETKEKQLATMPYDDTMWQREARHQAVELLSQVCFFRYERSFKDHALSEMAPAKSPELARLDVLATVVPTLVRDVFDPLHAQLVRLLTKHADGSGHVPPGKLPLVRQQAAALVQRTFLGQPHPDGSLHPYLVVHGQVQPRSAYFAALWRLMQHAATVAVDRHAALMRQYLPDDLIRAFSQAYLEPQDHELAEADSPQYDPLHLWIGPDGKKLSDRIWNLTGDFGRKLDAYLTEAIASGKNATYMAGELERFLIPGTSHQLVSTPYGDVTYEALRLARTEVSAAGHRADWIAAQSNPLVEKYQPVLSPSHQEVDECDVNAAGGPYDKDDPSHLPPRHPNCLDSVIWIVVEHIEAAVKSLREQIADALARGTHAITDFLNPLVQRFKAWLFRGAV